MAGKIFINYRRGDDPGNTGRLFDRLEDAFPRDQLFIDVDSIPPGHDFVRVLEHTVAQCDVLLAVIGKGWLQARDEQGIRCLDKADDFVRIEIASALKQDKLVIPVLVQDTQMPKPDELPKAIRSLARRNAVRLTHERFKADTQHLVTAIQQALEKASAIRRAQEEAVRKAAAEEEHRREEESRLRAQAEREADEQLRQEKEQARLGAIAGLSPEHIAKAEELANWDFIKGSENSQDFRDHLARFPKGVTERMVRTKLEAIVWTGLTQPADASSLQGFLEEFPNGGHAGEAKSKLAELERLAAAARDAEERQRRETEAWASASAAGNVAALEAFPNDWPDSNEAHVARKRIKEVKGVPTRRWLLQGLGGAVGLAVVTGATFVELQPGRLLWRLLYHSAIRTFTGHSDWVTSVAFAPDGRTALSGSRDRTLKLWDVATGQEIRTFTRHYDAVYSVAFAPEGRTALSGSQDKTLKLWDVATGQEIRTFIGHSDVVNSVAFAPDGRTAVSGSQDKTLKLWDVATGRESRTFTGHLGIVTSVAFAPDGRTALSGSSDKTLKLWDVATGQEIRTFIGHSDIVNSVAFAPDGRTAVSGSSDETLRLWDVATGREIRTFTGHSDSVRSVAFAPDGRTALSGDRWDNALTLWDVATGRESRTFTGHLGNVTSVAFAPDGRTALSGSWDKTLKLWGLN
jgi:hypothetical protein